MVERVLELEPWKAAAGTGNSNRPSICVPSVRIRTGKTSDHLNLAGVDRVCSKKHISPINVRPVALLPETNIHLINLEKVFISRDDLNAERDF